MTDFGKYRLIRRIAQGGMAEIHLAIQRGPHGFEKVLVLKVILPELCKNDDFVQMFLDEARLAANLDHNNVVRVYDFGEADGQYYIAMEHLPGEDLASVLQAARRRQSILPLEFIADVIAGAATGLHFAHEKTDSRDQPLNIVHRDVSPSNIIVTYHGTVKVLDFGIARAETNLQQTAAGTVKGKMNYLSPEQARGEPLDRRSDVFGLGTVTYELLTTRRLFKQESDLATLKAVLEMPIVPPSTVRPDVPPELDDIVLKAMSRDVDQRYQSAAEYAEALNRFLMNRGYVRSEKALADFMTVLFDPERRAGKLKVSSIAESEAESQRTPSQLKRPPSDFSPLRSTVDARREPAPMKKSRLGLMVGAVFGLLLIGVAAGVVLHEVRGPRRAEVIALPRAPEPIADVTPPPMPPPEPARAVEPEPTPVAEPTPAEPVAQKTKVVAARARGKLTLDSAPWAEVYLGNKKLGDTPLVELPLPAGVHVLKLVNDEKGIRRSIEVEIEAGKTTIKRLTL